MKNANYIADEQVVKRAKYSSSVRFPFFTRPFANIHSLTLSH